MPGSLAEWNRDLQSPTNVPPTTLATIRVLLPLPSVGSTLEEILAELERNAVKVEAGAMTTKEWARHWNVSQYTARNLIRTALETDRMTPQNVVRENIMRPGYRSKFTVYKLVGGGA